MYCRVMIQTAHAHRVAHSVHGNTVRFVRFGVDGVLQFRPCISKRTLLESRQINHSSFHNIAKSDLRLLSMERVLGSTPNRWC